MKRRSLLVGGVSAVALMNAATTFSVLAQSFPAGDITITYPFPAGSGVDTTLRAISEEAGKILGTTVLYENRPGALGRPAVAALVGARPDGHTLAWVGESNLVIQVIADPNYNFVLHEQYEPVALGLRTPLVVVARTDLPFDDIAGLIEYAKANPKALKFANSGLGSTGHLIAESLVRAAGIEVTPVPYQGVPAALTDLMGGRVDLLVATSTAKPHIEAGTLKALASTGDETWSEFPNLPTIREAGLDVSGYTYFGAVVPVGTPPEVIAALNSAINEAMATEAVKTNIAQFGYDGDIATTPDEFGALILSEIERKTPIVEGAGVTF